MAVARGTRLEDEFIVPARRKRKPPTRAERLAADLKRLGFLGATKADRERRVAAALRAQKLNTQRLGKGPPERLTLKQAMTRQEAVHKAGLDLPNVPGVRYAAGQAREVATALTQSIPGTWGLLRDLDKDMREGKITPLGGLVSKDSRTERNLKEMGRAQLELLKEPQKHPALLALTIGRPVTATAAGAAARAATAGRAARAGKGTAAVARAAVAKPKTGEAFGAARTFKIGELEVPANYSRAADVEALQRASDVVRKRFPKLGFSSGPVVTRNLPARVGFEAAQNRRITDAVASAEALGLAAKTRLSKFPRKRQRQQVEQTAARVEFEGATVAERIALHEQQAAKAKSPVARRRIERKIGLLQQAGKLLEDTPGGPQVKLTNAALRALMRKAEQVAAARTESLLERGAITEAQAAARVQGPGRVVQGARFEPATLEGAIPYFTLGKRVRSRGGSARTGSRPRTAAEATARIAELEAFVEPRVAQVYNYIRESSPTSARGRDTRPRRAQSDTDKFRGTKADRRRAEQMLYEKAAASNHPTLVQIREAMDERDDLSAQLLREKEGSVFGAPGAPAADLGTVVETIPGRPPVRGIVIAVDAAAGTARVRPYGKGKPDRTIPLDQLTTPGTRKGRITGAEDFTAGKVRVPYTARFEKTPLGRMTLDAGKVIGKPREQGTVTHAFKGGRLLTSNFRDDALRLIAEDALAETRQTGKLGFRAQMEKAATQQRVDDRQVAMRVGKLKDPAAAQQLRDALARPEDVLPSKRMRQATESDPFKQVRVRGVREAPAGRARRGSGSRPGSSRAPGVRVGRAGSSSRASTLPPRRR